MAGWISSKLKVAETFLQQIDQQAAESLRKGEQEESLFVDADEDDNSRKVEPIPVKLQLPRKPLERARSRDADNRPARVFNSADVSRSSASSTAPIAEASSATSVMASMDGDWTKLLSSSSSIGIGASTSTVSFPSPRSTIRQGSSNRRSSGKPGRENEQRRRAAPDRAAFSSTRRRLIPSEVAADAFDSLKDRTPSESLGVTDVSVPEAPRDENFAEKYHLDESEEVDSPIPAEDGVAHSEELVTNLKGKTDENAEDVPESAVPLRNSPNKLLRITQEIRGSSLSDSESSSSSDSEYEREREMERRKRREKILAEKAAALAADAIKERENLVARLEGEKESLEKVVEERQKQQAQEASQLQSSMMETMEAVELEKQKHNSTRMEAFALLAELETRNAELSRFLASTQWDLQVEVDRVLDLREMIESKELAQEEIRRRMSDIRLKASSDHKDEKRNEYEHKVLEAEYHFICDKIGQMKEKVRTLERNIQTTKELAHPTGNEIELKKRLEQLTDHLIQKQAQVETLSSEKATLQFRTETVSRLVAGEENREEGDQGLLIPAAAVPARVVDIDGGGAMATLGERKVDSLLGQLELVFAAGALFLRKNPAAKISAWVYLLCLHLWVGYILTSAS